MGLVEVGSQTRQEIFKYQELSTTSIASEVNLLCPLVGTGSMREEEVEKRARNSVWVCGLIHSWQDSQHE
jgi:hypothetical protein